MTSMSDFDVSARIATAGQEIVLNMDDISHFEFATPRDVHDTTTAEEAAAGVSSRRLGLGHLELKFHYKKGRFPMWAPVENKE